MEWVHLVSLPRGSFSKCVCVCALAWLAKGNCLDPNGRSPEFHTDMLLCISYRFCYYTFFKLNIGINFQHFIRTLPFVSKGHFLNMNSKSYALDKNLVEVSSERQVKFGITTQY